MARAQKRRYAFTLVETIIGMLMMTIVMGGIITGLNMGLRLYARAEANGKVTNGARFTAASFKQKIWPMMSRASIVEILPSLPDTSVSDPEDCYVYLDEAEQCVKCRIGGKDDPLTGSEFITSLDFSVPASSADLAENFILRMRVEAQAPKVKSAHVTLDIDSALVNRPAKRGSGARASVYNGPVLHFNIFDFRDLQIRNRSDNDKILQNEEAVEKDSVLQVRYDIIVPPDKKDATKILWYASTESKATLKKSAGYWEETEYPAADYDNNKGDHYWPLLIKSDDAYYLAGDRYKKASGKGDEFLEIPTSETLYVYTGTKLYGENADFDDDGKLKNNANSYARQFGAYAFLRAWVVPAYDDAGGGAFSRPRGYEQWSVRVKIQPSEVRGRRWFDDLTQHMIDGGTKDIYLDSTDSNFTATGRLDPGSGEYSATIKYKAGNNHIQLAAALRPEDIGDARGYEKKIFGGNSYTNITNYSIIIDAEAGKTTAGIALLLNGYRNKGATSGYCFYYDPGANGYPIRLQNTTGNVDGYKRYGVQEIDSPIESVINNSTTIGSISGEKSGTFYSNYYNPQYVNTALQNETFKTTESAEASLRGTKGDFTDECKAMQPRRRYMVTILEYHTGDKENPRLLVRMRLLKNLGEVMEEYPRLSEKELRAEDPFLCGPRFYYSEPAWYGNFVGQKPKITSRGNNYTLTFKAKRYGADTDIQRTGRSKTENDYYGSGKSFYTVQTPNGNNSRYKNNFSRGSGSNSKNFDGGVYKAQSLDPRKELSPNDNTASKLGKLTPDRYRWIGFAIWGGQLGGNSSVEIYNMTIAPGFDRGELQSIMESGAKVFGMDETNGSFPTADAEYSATNDMAAKWNSELFGISSDGNGNQSHNNAYVGRFKNADIETQPCVMSLQHTSSGYSASCGCPMCSAYGRYNGK
ncbi:PulJ/GspJ family protein [Cloacibacillus evryensis]|uniref:PulJ/GspJ family protein n=1 Tax=Cloacibacillus evryensis TaxID=508460 RepID=UPI0026713598|nr:hypothetical protein [Cloacibacillus evryensis]